MENDLEGGEASDAMEITEKTEDVVEVFEGLIVGKITNPIYPPLMQMWQSSKPHRNAGRKRDQNFSANNASDLVMHFAARCQNYEIVS